MWSVYPPPSGEGHGPMGKAQQAIQTHKPQIVIKKYMGRVQRVLAPQGSPRRPRHPKGALSQLYAVTPQLV